MLREVSDELAPGGEGSGAKETDPLGMAGTESVGTFNDAMCCAYFLLSFDFSISAVIQSIADFYFSITFRVTFFPTYDF
jgi:hypothetical protein